MIGLYIAYVIPIYLRWRMGDALRGRPVDARQQVPAGCARSPCIEVIVICIYMSLPFGPAGIPGRTGFALDNGVVNYAPVLGGRR